MTCLGGHRAWVTHMVATHTLSRSRAMLLLMCWDQTMQIALRYKMQKERMLLVMCALQHPRFQVILG